MIPRYSRPEMTSIWEPQTRFRIWFEIEAYACEALAELVRHAAELVVAHRDEFPAAWTFCNFVVGASGEGCFQSAERDNWIDAFRLQNWSPTRSQLDPRARSCVRLHHLWFRVDESLEGRGGMLIRARGEVVGDRRHGAIISHTMHLNAPDSFRDLLIDVRRDRCVLPRSLSRKREVVGFRDRYATRDPKQIRVIR